MQFLAFPFALNHPSVDMSRVSATWPGQIDIGSLGSYIDQLIMVILGGIPWQVNVHLDVNRDNSMRFLETSYKIDR